MTILIISKVIQGETGKVIQGETGIAWTHNMVYHLQYIYNNSIYDDNIILYNHSNGFQ